MWAVPVCYGFWLTSVEQWKYQQLKGQVHSNLTSQVNNCHLMAILPPHSLHFGSFFFALNTPVNSSCKIPVKLQSSFSFKNVGIRDPPPPLRIPNDFPWGGYGYFLDLLLQCRCMLKFWNYLATVIKMTKTYMYKKGNWYSQGCH